VITDVVWVKDSGNDGRGLFQGSPLRSQNSTEDTEENYEKLRVRYAIT